MTDLKDLNKNTPATQPTAGRTAAVEAEKAHRRIENEANKDGQRGMKRQKEEDQGEFSNIGPV